jgi:hypothetical protein
LRIWIIHFIFPVTVPRAAHAATNFINHELHEFPRIMNICCEFVFEAKSNSQQGVHVNSGKCAR